jgi:regulator of sigma E protease
MSSIPLTIVGFIVAVSVLVAVHEFGHYSVARLLSIKVLRFSIGFGRPLWRRRGRNGTEFVVAAIPLGGYVKMLDEREGEVAEADRPFAFNRQSIPKRAAVLAAGPAFNLAFAIAAYWLVFVLGVPGIRPIVGDIAKGSYAEAAGFQARDEITAVAGRDVATWDGALFALLREVLDGGAIPVRVRDPDGTVRELVLEVGDNTEPLTEPGALLRGLGLSWWSPPLPPRLAEVVDGGAAATAGLRGGDLITAADGAPVADWQNWVDYIQARPGQTVEVGIERDGQKLELPLTIGEIEQDGKHIGRIGAAPETPENFGAELRTEQRYAPLEAIGIATDKTADMAVVTLRMFWKMLVGEVSVRNISGPISIAEFAGDSLNDGLVSFLLYLAIISISLGLINLMPIPLLDGGQLLYAAIEAIKGAPLSQRAELIGQQVGVALLLVLMSVAFYNDITSRLVN